MDDLKSEEIVRRWLSAFASNVPEDIMKEHIVKSYNFLWHIFTWGNVPCIVGDDARKAFDALSFEKAITFKSGYSINDKPQIEDVKWQGKISAAALDDLSDIYFVDEHFQWTYVHTHEENCGPYFCCENNHNKQ